MDDIGKTVASNIVYLRTLRGWTQEMLAERADMSLTGLQGLESGRRWPERDTVTKVAKALGEKQARLFHEVDPNILRLVSELARSLGMELQQPKRRRGPRPLKDA